MKWLPIPAAAVLAIIVLATSAGVALTLLLSAASRSVVEFDLSADDVCIVPTARITAATPFDPASGLERHAARAVPTSARCPVCGMFPARYPRWAAQVVFDDGAAHFFDSAADMLHFLRAPERYDEERSAAEVAAVYVTDYASGTWVDAHAAHFVSASSVPGPMRGADLPAFADPATATSFVAEHGGTVFAYDAIPGAVIDSLQRAHAH